MLYANENYLKHALIRLKESSVTSKSSNVILINLALEYFK